ncbi:MAG: putative membrane protein [Pseudorhodobacter sp.]|jgi:uncharacterized membrane protein
MTQSNTVTPSRLLGLDLARSLALLGMAIYHFTYDLELFGLIAPGTALNPPFSILARVVAGSFLALAGFSLVLAHDQGTRWAAFGRRLAVIGSAAAAITFATYFAIPDAFIFFGILHSIAACSVLGLVFLRVPVWLLLALAAFIAALPSYARFEAFDAPLLSFIGLGHILPVTVDFEPLFPWFGAFLAGMALARMAQYFQLLHPRVASPFLTRISWPGRYSLWIYLAHQPVLIGILWVFVKLAGQI